MPNTTGAELKLQIQDLNTLRKLPNYDHKDPKAVAERVDFYFEFCANRQKRPTVEGLSLALGITRQALFVWESKQDERAEIVKQAKALLNALIVDWACEGRINPVTMIFLSKNNFQYRDSVQIEAGRIGEENLPSKETIIADLQETLASQDSNLLTTKAEILKNLPVYEAEGEY